MYRLSLLFLIVAVGCQSPPTQKPSESQFTRGDKIYATYCAVCHEVDPGIGPKLIPQVIATRVNAQLLYNYNKRNMPYEAENTLQEQQYWDVTAYLVMRGGFMDSTEVLSSENAEALSLTLPALSK